MNRKNWRNTSQDWTAVRWRRGVVSALVIGVVGVVIVPLALAQDVRSCTAACCAASTKGVDVSAASSTEQNAAPLACNLNGLNPQQQERRAAIWEILKPQIHEVQEREAGYAFRFVTSARVLTDIAELVTLEMRCCPFLHFEVVVSEDGGPTWLHLSGREGVKGFLAAVIATES